MKGYEELTSLDRLEGEPRGKREREGGGGEGAEGKKNFEFRSGLCQQT